MPSRKSLRPGARRGDPIFKGNRNSLTTNLVETSRTIFHYVKRSNRSAEGKRQAVFANEENTISEARKIINSADPTTMIKVQQPGLELTNMYSKC